MSEKDGEEAAAWNELDQRMRFFAESLGRGDPDMSEMAARRLGEALARLKPLYGARLAREFGQEKAEESP
jgi:hypothetical protein